MAIELSAGEKNGLLGRSGSESKWSLRRFCRVPTKKAESPRIGPDRIGLIISPEFGRWNCPPADIGPMPDLIGPILLIPDLIGPMPMPIPEDIEPPDGPELLEDKNSAKRCFRRPVT